MRFSKGFFGASKHLLNLSAHSFWDDSNGKIRGPNHVVQIDKCKTGKQKFHREEWSKAVGFWEC